MNFAEFLAFRALSSPVLCRVHLLRVILVQPGAWGQSFWWVKTGCCIGIWIGISFTRCDHRFSTPFSRRIPLDVVRTFLMKLRFSIDQNVVRADAGVTRTNDWQKRHPSPSGGHLYIFRDIDAAGLGLGFAIHSDLPMVAKVGPEQNSGKSGSSFASLGAAKSKAQESAQAQGRSVETREKLRKTSHTAPRAEF
jgi:hypothetical protein